MVSCGNRTLIYSTGSFNSSSRDKPLLSFSTSCAYLSTWIPMGRGPSGHTQLLSRFNFDMTIVMILLLDPGHSSKQLQLFLLYNHAHPPRVLHIDIHLSLFLGFRMVLKFHAPFCNIELALTKYRALTRKPSSHGACIMMGHMDPQAELRLAR